MRNNTPFNIGYQNKGLSNEATEESKAIVKETYRALKKRKKFFNFQLSFNPMEGHVLSPWNRDEKSEDAIVIRNMKINPTMKFCGLSFMAKHGYEYKAVLNVPIIRRLVILRSMLDSSYNNIRREHKVSIKDVASMYCEDYYEEYKKTHKPVPNELTVAWYGAIAITSIFYITMMWVLYIVSPILTFTLLLMHSVVFAFYLIYLTFNKF
jgi:hypothetical protein